MSFYEELLDVAENDGFVFIVLEGAKGFGKSTAMLDFLYNVISLWTGEEGEWVWDKVLRHTVFTINDFWNLGNRNDLVRVYGDKPPVEGKNPALIIGWDDMALHLSGQAYLRGEGAEIGEFVEDFEAVREDVSILFGTVATFRKLPPSLRESGEINIRIKMKERGYGIIYRIEESKKDLDRFVWRKIGEIYFRKIPEDIYNEYVKLKIKAKQVRKQKIILKKLEKAKELAEELTEEDWNDELKLIALGIKDIHGNWTDFGLKVRELWEGYIELSENVADDSKLEKIVEWNITRNKIRALLKHANITAGDHNIDKFVGDLRRFILELLRMAKNNEIERISLAKLFDIIEVMN
jgi:hypothetical protein